MNRGCANCEHPAEVHRRGWGPCTSELSTGTDGVSYLDLCRCRRFVTAKRPVGRNGR